MIMQENMHQDNDFYLRDDTVTETNIVRRTDNSIWLPAIFLIALFFFTGLGIWNLANYRYNINNSGENGTQVGIGGAPENDLVSPLPDNTTSMSGPISSTGATGVESR